MPSAPYQLSFLTDASCYPTANSHRPLKLYIYKHLNELPVIIRFLYVSPETPFQRREWQLQVVWILEDLHLPYIIWSFRYES